MFVSDDDHKALVDAIEGESYDYRHMTERAEIIDYYQDKYGDSGWRGAIINKLMEITGKSKNTVSREYQYDKRIGKERYLSDRITKATREKYEKLGKELPPVQIPRKLEGKRATVDFSGTVWISQKPYHKSFNKTLTPAQTARMREHGSYAPIMEKYGINPKDIDSIEVDSISIKFE